MKAGILLPQTGELATSENVLHIAREAEREGLELDGQKMSTTLPEYLSDRGERGQTNICKC